MIANISPSILSIEETLNTLKYANRAKNIKIKLKKNVVETDYHISKYDEVVRALKSEIEGLKDQLVKKKSDITNNISPDTSVLNNSQTETVENVENVQKEISDHFNQEIKLRKEILENEKSIENNKNIITEKEFDLYKLFKKTTNANNIEADKNKKYILQLNNDIESIHKRLNEKYGKQSDLIKTRTTLQNLISKVTKENPTGGKILIHTYKYFTSLLENMTLEHRRNLNLSEIKRKDLQINTLLDQIKARDEMILSVNSEMLKKKIPMKRNARIKSIEEIEMTPLKLPVINPNNNLNTKSLNFTPITEKVKKIASPHSKIN
jgi:hypothetical protein